MDVWFRNKFSTLEISPTKNGPTGPICTWEDSGANFIYISLLVIRFRCEGDVKILEQMDHLLNLLVIQWQKVFVKPPRIHGVCNTTSEAKRTGTTWSVSEISLSNLLPQRA